VTGTETYLIFVLGFVALVWVGLTLYVLLTRVIHELGASLLDRTRGALAAAGHGADREVLLRRLPRRLVERAAADPATPEPIARLLADFLLERHAASILALARARGVRRRWRRIGALRILVRAGWQAAPPLLAEALESGDEELCAASVAMLGELGTDRAADVLLQALRTGRFSRSRIAAQLDVTPRPIGPLLSPLLDEREPQLRFWGATLLHRYAGERPVELELARAAADDDPSVRAAAVESLAAGGGPAATTTAVALLRDPVWFVRAHAARALRDLEGATGPAVAKLLADESWWVRAAAKEALEARPGRALEVLVGYLDHDDEFARNGAAEVLQNTGVLDALLMADDALVEVEGLGPAPVRRILDAGGPRMATTAAERNGLDEDELHRLAG
jgi:HEAT repeat protein